jgi:hypothetical protein
MLPASSCLSSYRSSTWLQVARAEWDGVQATFPTFRPQPTSLDDIVDDTMLGRGGGAACVGGLALARAAYAVSKLLLGPLLVTVLLVPMALCRDVLDKYSGNVTGSCFGYPNVTEAHDFFVAMATRVNSASIGTRDTGLARYPIDLGTSYEGRPLRALCLGLRCAAAGHDDEVSDPTIPQALFTGLHHAREPTSLGVLYFFVLDLVRKYVAQDPTTRLLLHTRQLWFVPIVNPDGYAANCRDEQGRMVRTNMRPACTRKQGNRGPGVDLNRNYAVCFERAAQDRSASTQPCSEDYQGTAPFSEPETAAIRDLTYRQNFTVSVNYHSYGKEITMPFGCKALGKPKGVDYDVFMGLGKRMTDLNGFMFGVGWEQPLDLYTVSGASQDWLFKMRGIYAFMSEVGPLYRSGQSMKPAFWHVLASYLLA